jgi:hypothetical protein
MSFGFESVEDCALILRRQWIDQPFGEIRFWGFAVVRPNDQGYVVVSVQTEEDRLDLTLVHESRQGVASVLSVWAPCGVRVDDGLVIEQAARLSMGDCVAWSDGEAQYRLRTPRGEGCFPMQSAPALRLRC